MVAPVNFQNAMDIARATVGAMVARLFGESDIALVGRERMVKAIAKLDRDNRYLTVELYCADPNHAYFRELSAEDRQILEEVRTARNTPPNATPPAERGGGN